jgi:hypothetical protein
MSPRKKRATGKKLGYGERMMIVLSDSKKL